ncbi:hypothetical protein CPB83DRAFT_871970 [Crepidotus variabilis]|uniref:Uncharacterized protein n=1 Tax=Crepidotus variabilis TaxID=179855 RepID=A0A9P6E4M7_9AGAR|nr:hypothetical protein CPB83DRAFT_871970 [Crepidotus variabilis]
MSTGEGQELTPSSPTEYESPSESSDEGEEHDGGVDEEEGEVEQDDADADVDAADEHLGVSEDEDVGGTERFAQPSPLKVDTSTLRSPRSSREHTPMSPKSRAWYEFDLAVVVALVSPIGNMLTGGDHIKNLLLIVLLIFYLHQIIEVPWSMYQKARPRNRAFHMPPVEPGTPEWRYAQIASSELQKWELFYLGLTFLSPLVGAFLLRYSTASILGDEAVSWFSTGLFVLATGVRPWSHLVDRLNKRTDELHEFVHYPSPTRTASEEQHTILEARVEQIEKALSKLKMRTARTSEDLLDYMNDNLEDVVRSLKKQERKMDKCEGRVKEVETGVGQLRSGMGIPKPHSHVSFTSMAPHVNISVVKTYIYDILEHVLPIWLITSPPNKTHHQPHKVPMRPLGHHSASSPTVSTLETIEEEDFENEKYPALARPSSFTSELVHQTGSVVTMPLRAVARMVLRTY